MTAVTVNSKGTTFSRGSGSGSPETFATIGQVTDFDGLSPTRKSIDITTLDDDYMIKSGGSTIDSGQVSLDLLYDPDNAAMVLLEADIEVTNPGNFKITLTDGTVFAFKALVTSIKRTGKKDDKIKATVTLDISGEVTKT